jgi:hypothetical protein
MKEASLWIFMYVPVEFHIKNNRRTTRRTAAAKWAMHIKK